MLTEICREIRNYFCYQKDKHFGDFKIEGGVITPQLDFVTEYYAIFGSRKNNGVHKTTDVLEDEEFTGSIWIMSPPAAFLSLVDEISAWQEKYGGADSEALSPFNSESFGGYSYSKSAGSSGQGASATTWQGAYAARLNLYRRARLQ